MRNKFTKLTVLGLSLLTFSAFTAKAQDSDKKEDFKPHGKLWGYAFADYYVKAHADTVNGGRGGSNQYTKVPKDHSSFQFRRIYLGYDYAISKKFSAEFLLAAEDDISGGDVLADGKFTPYVKLANIRWHNIWKGTDLAIGQVSTPAFPMMSEPTWGYRSVERTVTDIRRTPSFDMGITLQGHLPNNDNYGYDVMVGNGQAAAPEAKTDNFKWFYGDVYAKFLNKRLIVDLYGDYQRMNWNPTWHHARSMGKLFVAYTTPKLTVGVEAFVNNLMGDNIATKKDGSMDTLTTKSSAIAIYVRGRLYKDKVGFFARYDTYNPSGNVNNDIYSNYSPLTSQYDPNTKENFITAGLDFTPVKNVHIMPNIWYNGYKNAGPHDYGTANNDYDLTYRLTFYYIYGK